MIIVRAQKNHLTINGHAEYAAMGKDIVCAAVSGLVWAYVDSCSKRDINYTIAEGEASITIKRNTIPLEARTQMLITGLTDIAREYPKHLTIIR